MSPDTRFNNNEKLYLAYELVMAGLALAVAGILVIEFTQPLTSEQKKLAWCDRFKHTFCFCRRLFLPFNQGKRQVVVF